MVFSSERFSGGDIIKYARAAERSGFDSIWVAEHLFSRDAFVLLSAAAVETEKIKLSTGIVNVYSRNPVQVAMSAAALNELSDGRMILGIGLGNTALLWKMGVTTRNHLQEIKSYTLALKELLSGRTVTRRGSHFDVDGIKLSFNNDAVKIPIYLAAVRPKMLGIAGEIADGILLSSMVSTKYVLTAIEHARTGAENVGKSTKDLAIACFISVFVSKNPERAQVKAREFVLRSLSNPGIFSDPNLWETIFGKELRHTLIAIRKSILGNDMKTASRHLTDDMVNLVTISGGPEKCRSRIQEFVRAGINLPVINPIPGSDPLNAISTFSNE